MKTLYMFFFGSRNIAWCSISMIRFKGQCSKQKRTIKAILMTSVDYLYIALEEITNKLGIADVLN